MKKLLLILLTWMMISTANVSAQTRSINVLDFKGFPVSFQEIVKACQKNGATLGPTYNPRAIAAVRSILEKMLEEKGHDGIVNVEITSAPQPGSMKITFSAVAP